MRLENLSLGHRIALTFCTVLAILFALALYGFLTGGWDRAEGAPNQAESKINIYQGIPLDAHLLALDKDALEQAYKQHLGNKLWATWLSDGASIEGGERIKRGLANARRAYALAAEQIERREKEIQERK